MTNLERLKDVLMESPTLGGFYNGIVETSTMDLINEKTSILKDTFLDFYHVLFVFSLVIYGIKIMTGDSKDTPKDLIVSSIWVIIALTITKMSLYKELILIPFLNTPEDIALFFLESANGTSTNIFELIQLNFEESFSFAGTVIASGGFTDLVPLIGGLLLALLYAIFYGSFLVIFLYSKIALCIFLVLGIIIIPLGAFKSCRAVFKSWIIALVKYSTVLIILCLIMRMMNNITSLTLYYIHNTIYGTGTLSMPLLSREYGSMLFTAFLGIILITKAVEMTTELTGGLGSNTGGMLNSIATAGRNLKLLKSPYNLVTAPMNK